MTSDFDYSADLPTIERYNARKMPGSAYRLQTHMTPAPYDGAPDRAEVILLMNNPGFDAGSVPTDHTMVVDGWPLVGLSPQARPGYRAWYFRPLGYLIDCYGAQQVANKVAIIQRNPWASKAFDRALVLPSQARQIELVRMAIQRGAVVVAGRSFKFWHNLFAGQIHFAKNVRNPTISPKGICTETFDTIKRKFKS